MKITDTFWKMIAMLLINFLFYSIEEIKNMYKVQKHLKYCFRWNGIRNFQQTLSFLDDSESFPQFKALVNFKQNFFFVFVLEKISESKTEDVPYCQSAILVRYIHRRLRMKQKPFVSFGSLKMKFLKNIPNLREAPATNVVT